MVIEEPVNTAELPVVQCRQNYAFIMNLFDLGDLRNYELAPGHMLRRATHDEIETIRGLLPRLGAAWDPWKGTLLWECQWPHRGGVVERLPEEQWRYFVIAFEGTNHTINSLQQAMDVPPVELEIAFTILRDRVTPPGIGFTWSPGRLFHLLQNANLNEATFFRTLMEPELHAIASLHASFVAHDTALIDVKRFAQQVGGLKAFPSDSPLRFLGFFAVLESLLTHAPKPGDPYDSITRQVTKKVALLDRRWAPRLDYSPFGGASQDKVWARMYQYRSLLAHGGQPTFAGDLALLGDHQLALKLVRDAVKAIIRQAVAEPELLIDLREC
jgi:hypothetical protein